METTKDQQCILDAVNYDDMEYLESKYAFWSDGGVWREATFDAFHASLVVEVTKNYLGPKIEAVASAGAFKIKSGGKAIESVNFDCFKASAGVSASNTHAGAEWKATLAGGSASIFDLHLGAGLSSGAGIEDDSVSLKGAGCGFKIGRKVEISVFDNSFGIDFGRLFG